MQDFTLKIPSSIKEELLNTNGYDFYPDILELNSESKLEELTQVIANKPNGVPIVLENQAAKEWFKLSLAAEAEGLNLIPISGYRSTEYQQGIIERALEKGRTWESIADFIALPGYSQHHTGRAVDVTTPELLETEDPLVAEFANTKEYLWLQENGIKFGFTIPFNSRDREKNPGMFCFEPWHLFFNGFATY